MEIINSFSLAISLSIDACMMSIAYGLLNLKKRDIIITSILVGVFHFIMPLIGKSIINNSFINIDSNIILLIILIILGFQVLKEKKEETEKHFSIFTPVIFSFLVSIDSLLIGMGIDAISENYIVTLVIFALTSFIFTYCGFTFSNYIKEKYQFKLEIISICIIFTLIAYFFVKMMY